MGRERMDWHPLQFPCAVPPQPPFVCTPQAILKTSIGQVSLFPLYLGSALMALQLLEGKTFEAAAAKLQESFVSTYLIGTVFWPAANVASEWRGDRPRSGGRGVGGRSWEVGGGGRISPGRGMDAALDFLNQWMGRWATGSEQFMGGGPIAGSHP